jgi:hypothetical protein
VTIDDLERTPNTRNIECQIIYWNTDGANGLLDGVQLICGNRAADGK